MLRDEPSRATATPSAAPVVEACVVLAGGLRPSPLIAECGVSVLDLPIRADLTVLDGWLRAIRAEGRTADATVRVVVNARLPVPESVGRHGPSATLVHERDDFRGPAGSVRDACEDLDGAAWILAVESGRYLPDGLDQFVGEILGSDADVGVACNPDRSPSGVYAFRRRALDMIPARGFMDLKEQWLAKVVREGMAVRVHRLADPGAVRLATREEFLRGVRVAHGLAEHAGRVGSLWGHRPDHRSVICPGARVDPQSVVVDSVVMSGAAIAPGAVVARSIVCRNASIKQGAAVIDACVPAGETIHPGGSVAIRTLREGRT